MHCLVIEPSNSTWSEFISSLIADLEPLGHSAGNSDDGCVAVTLSEVAELTLKFLVSKKGWRSYWSIIAAIASAIALVIGGALVKDNAVVGGILLTIGTLLAIVAYYLWTGRIRLPGSR